MREPRTSFASRQQAQDKAEKLAGELAAARQEVEAQTTVARAASEEARQAAETSKRSAEEQGQALREAQGKAEKLTAEWRQRGRKSRLRQRRRGRRDEARPAAETSKRSADEQGQALREAQGKAENLAAELAAARREVQSWRVRGTKPQARKRPLNAAPTSSDARCSRNGTRQKSSPPNSPRQGRAWRHKRRQRPPKRLPGTISWRLFEGS